MPQKHPKTAFPVPCFTITNRLKLKPILNISYCTPNNYINLIIFALDAHANVMKTFAKHINPMTINLLHIS